MAETVGSRGRLAVDTATPFDASSLWIEFDSESIIKRQEILFSDGIRGTRSRDNSRGGLGPKAVTGSVSGVVTRQALDFWLPAVLGSAESSNVFDVAETLPDLYLLIDKGTDIVLVSEAKVNVFTLDMRGPIVKYTAQIEAEDMTGGQSWPGTLTQPDLTQPYLFTDLGNITIDGTARVPFGCTITINNYLTADQWGNKLTRDELIVANDRGIDFSVMVSGDTANSDLLDHVASVGVDGEAIQLVLTSAGESGSSITIDLGRVAFPPQQPVTTDKRARRFELTGQARAYLHPGTGSHVPDIKFTNAHS